MKKIIQAVKGYLILALISCFSPQNSRGVVSHVESRRSLDGFAEPRNVNETGKLLTSNKEVEGKKPYVNGSGERNNGLENPKGDTRVEDVYELLLKVYIEREPLISLLKALRQGSSTKDVKLLPPEEVHYNVEGKNEDLQRKLSTNNVMIPFKKFQG